MNIQYDTGGYVEKIRAHMTTDMSMTCVTVQTLDKKGGETWDKETKNYFLIS